MALSSIMTGALLSANTSRQIAHVQHATKKQMDGHAGVLDAEIKLDSARGRTFRSNNKYAVFVHHTIRTTLIAGNMLY